MNINRIVQIINDCEIHRSISVDEAMYLIQEYILDKKGEYMDQKTLEGSIQVFGAETMVNFACQHFKEKHNLTTIFNNKGEMLKIGK